MSGYSTDINYGEDGRIEGSGQSTNESDRFDDTIETTVLPRN
jgi:hypothetical protein